jgi:hydrogenase maturation protease
MNPLVIGVGNRWRRDDGVGPRVVDAIAALGRDDLDLLVLDGEPARLAAAWAGRSCVVVIDAIRAGAPPGTIHRLADVDTVPPASPAASTHGGGVAAAIALTRALGALPGGIVILGVEPATVGHGDGLSPAVADAVAGVVERALEEVAGTCV